MQNAETVSTRRRMLRKWIDDNFNGSQAEFLRDIASRHPDEQLNQSELSGLLKEKSFGEKKARKLEHQAEMPDGYLDNHTKKVVKKLTDPDDLARSLLDIYNQLDDARKFQLLSLSNKLINEQMKQVGTVFNPFPTIDQKQEEENGA